MRARYLFILLFIVIGVVIAILYPTEKGRIRAVIKDAEGAIEREDLEALMENISYNYKDGYGNNYLLLKERMRMIFRQFDEIVINREFREILINGKEAEVIIMADVIASEGDERGYIIGDVEPGVIKVYLEKVPYRWRIRRVDLGSEGSRIHRPPGYL